MTTEEDSGFIPSTDLIRNAYRALALRPAEEAVLVAEFDRWLRERDATNRREAWEVPTITAHRLSDPDVWATICALCGVEIVRMDLHQAWHEDLESLAAVVAAVGFPKEVKDND